MRHLLPALALAAALAAGASASAQPADQMQAAHSAVRQACAADTARLCAGVQPGGGRLGQCMRSHRQELSAGCRDAIMQMHQAHAAAQPH